ncbi:hypothetical protein IQ238_13125 [Pleurocapsales cyanobacterium LEGE 06147]|nr:hypothetical protein [Pleurocapsales cyanobacterium LEGE 06147]
MTTLNSDRQQIQQLTQQWINLWSPKDKPFTGEGFEQIFATGENEILVFDNFDGSVVVLHSLQEYLDTWVPVMQQFAYWEIALEDNLEISILVPLQHFLSWVADAVKMGRITNCASMVLMFGNA